MPVADIRNRPMQDFGNPDDAYAAAVALDTIAGYEQFLSLYPDSPYSQRVAAMLAIRREEIVWRRCVTADTPPAYWSYLRRYPNGPHAWDARRRLAMLGAPIDPPPDFAMFDFGVPPPPPDELEFVDQPIVMFEGPRLPAAATAAGRSSCRRGRANSRAAAAAAAARALHLADPRRRRCSRLCQAAAHRRRAAATAGAARRSGGRPEFRVSLPEPCSRAHAGSTGAPGTPGVRPGFGAPGRHGAGAAASRCTGRAAAPPPPSAFVKPALAPPPPHPVGPAPAFVKPPPPPPLPRRDRRP